MESIAIAEGSTNWNGGQRITLHQGKTAQCTVLNPGQLYGIMMYNSAQHATNATVNVVWSNAKPPVPVTLPGTTANAGACSVGFVSGTDTQTVSVSLGSGSGDNAQVELWLGSVSMPTDTSGIENSELQANGEAHDFSKFYRYYAVPAASWYNVNLSSTKTQFISVQYRNASAEVVVLNETSNGLLAGQIANISPTTQLPGVVTITPVQIQQYSYNIQGDGTQWVWMDADSEQNSGSATIALQSM